LKLKEKLEKKKQQIKHQQEKEKKMLKKPHQLKRNDYI
jgi:hypothetical protein